MSPAWRTIDQIVIGSVWVFHGLYSKILNRIPRHGMIVEKILGDSNAGFATKSIGLLESTFGSLGLHRMAAGGLCHCPDMRNCRHEHSGDLPGGELLISAVGMVLLNLGFLGLVWCWALALKRG